MGQTLCSGFCPPAHVALTVLAKLRVTLEVTTALTLGRALPQPYREDIPGFRAFLAALSQPQPIVKLLYYRSFRGDLEIVLQYQVFLVFSDAFSCQPAAALTSGS